MERHNDEAAARLDDAWDRLVTGEPADPEDADLAETARQLRVRDDAPPPDPAFARRLLVELTGVPSAALPSTRGRSARRMVRVHQRTWRLAWLATAAALVLTLIGVAFGAARPQPVSARAIIEKAQAVATNPAAGGVASFDLTETRDSQATDRNGQIIYTTQTETHRWYQAPDRYRIEMTHSQTPAPGAPPYTATATVTTVIVSDGTATWTVNGNNVGINTASKAKENATSGLLVAGGTVNDLNSLLASAQQCFTPTAQGSETIAGRATWVIALGATKCPSLSAPEANNRRVLSVDKETFFVLKDVWYDAAGTHTIATTTITSVQYNTPIDPARFIYTAPPGAIVIDYRPQPAPSANQFTQQLETFATQADFPLFVPRTMSRGMVAQAPRLVYGALTLGYAPPGDPDKDAAILHGISVYERKALAADLKPLADAEPVQIGALTGWYRAGKENVGKSTTNGALFFVRDGTAISLTTFTLTRDELLQIAASFGTVAGSHAPVTPPAPRTLAEVRARTRFPISVPTYVPAGLTPEPPDEGVGGDVPTVGINYDAPDGGIGMIVRDGEAGTELDADPRKDGEAVTLPDGTPAHFLPLEPLTYHGPVLWWVHGKVFVAVSGPNLTKDELIRVAASMSETADLGTTTIPPSRPTATAIPAPAFTILRPTSLPEQLTERQQFVASDVAGVGPGVLLAFSRPNDPPQSALLLREVPRAAATAISDPQAVHELIGGRDVTIVKRGDDWVTLAWVQGDAFLRLTNPYAVPPTTSPFGPSSHPRFTPDQLRQIVASVR